MKKWNSRKFLSWLGCVILFTTLLVTGYINQNVYENLITALLLFYFAANVGDKIAQKIGGNNPGINNGD